MNSAKARREIVEAGAGCGKTTGLVARYLEGLGLLGAADQKQLKPTGAGFRAQEIYALTFTIEAAEQMKERILARLKEAGLDSQFHEVYQKSHISTIHSLCYQLLRPHLGEMGYNDELVVESAAHFARKSYAMQALARNPNASELLRVMPLEELLNITLKLWNSSALDADSTKLLGHLNGVNANFKKHCAELLAQSEDILVRFNEAIAKSNAKSNWILDLVAGLKSSDRSLIQGLSFRAFKEIKEAEPEYFSKVEALREFAKGSFWNSVGTEAIAAETHLEKSLKEFILSCRSNGPRLLDFSALEFELIQVLRRLHSTGERICPAPLLLLVDEFQDTNRIQMEILEHLSDEKTEWFLVGDPKQSIYAFRGSDVSLFIEARDRLSLLTLADNYRSHPKILNFINELQCQLFDSADPLDPPAQQLLVPKLREELTQQDSWQERVHLHAFPSASESTELWKKLAEDLKANQQRLGPDSTHAVLFQKWTPLRNFARFLEGQGIGYEILGSEAYLDHLLTDVFADFLTSADDAKNPRASFAIQRWNDGLSAFGEPAAGLEVAVDPIEALKQFSIAVECRRFPDGAEWLSAMSQYLQALLKDDLRFSLTIADLIFILRKQAKSAEVEIATQVFKKQGRQAGSLKLMTVHGSKGLQFDAVYLPELFEKRSQARSKIAEHDESLGFNFSLEDSLTGERRGSLLFLSRHAESERLKLAEQKRLFYVALTRAVECLSLYYRESPESRDEPSLNTALRILGWPTLKPCYWNDLIGDLEARGGWFKIKQALKVEHHLIDSTELDEKTRVEVAAANELWLTPLAKTTFLESADYHRMGVSRYLKLIEEDRKPIDESTESSAKPQWRHRASEIGNEFHAVLESWNGRAGSLEPLITDTLHANIFRQAVDQLRKLPELKDYWTDLEAGRVLREFGLFIIDDTKRLSGFADAVWFPQGKDPVVIDWKSSSSLAALKNPQRLDKIRAQLQLYQDALEKNGRYKPRRLAIGIELSHNAKVAVLLNE